MVVVVNVLVGMLVALALLAGLAGFDNLSDATLGVGFIGGACLLAIFARIAQASAHQAQLKSLLGDHEREV